MHDLLFHGLRLGGDFLAWGAVALFALAGLALSCLGISGGYLIAVAAAIAAPLTGPSFPGWGTPIAFAAVSLVVDSVEWMASHWGVRRRGGSKLAGFAAMIGGLLGMLAGSFVFPPVGSLLGMMAGSFGLAFAVERRRLQANSPAVHIATGAVLACVMMLLIKIAVALMLIATLVVGLIAG